MSQQSPKEAIILAAQILQEGKAWQWRGKNDWNGSYSVDEDTALALLSNIAKGHEIRLKPFALHTDPLGRKSHNPSNLTAEQVGEGYRLLLEDELDGRLAGNPGLDVWIAPDWVNSPHLLGQNKSVTFRVPSSTPYPPHKWSKEQDAFAAGKDVDFRTLLLGKWGDWCALCTTPNWNTSDVEFRIRPEPPPVKMVPLVAKDIPPGSVVRNEGEDFKEEWQMIIAITSNGVDVMRGSNSFEFVSFILLKNEYRILRPGSQTWERCEKPEGSA